MAGYLSQCFGDVPGFATTNAESFFKALATLTEIWDGDLNRNIAFCFAQMFDKSSQAMIPYLQHGLLILKNIYEHKSSHQACKQNALAALCKIIWTYNPPMPYEMFVGNLIQSMPFKGKDDDMQVTKRKNQRPLNV